MTGKILFLGASYLLGAIPFGVWIARIFYRVDIRALGSRNTGATNVWRVLGAVPGISTFLLDFLKGLAPVLAARALFPAHAALAVYAGVAAILGHNWSIFLKGKGGKGVATSTGVFIGLIPLHTLLAIAIFAIFFLTFRRISVASMAAAAALVLCTFWLETAASIRAVSILASAMIFIKHIPNLKRLARGEEPKVKLS